MPAPRKCKKTKQPAKRVSVDPLLLKRVLVMCEQQQQKQKQKRKRPCPRRPATKPAAASPQSTQQPQQPVCVNVTVGDVVKHAPPSSVLPAAPAPPEPIVVVPPPQPQPSPPPPPPSSSGPSKLDAILAQAAQMISASMTTPPPPAAVAPVPAPKPQIVHDSIPLATVAPAAPAPPPQTVQPTTPAADADKADLLQQYQMFLDKEKAEEEREKHAKKTLKDFDTLVEGQIGTQSDPAVCSEAGVDQADIREQMKLYFKRLRNDLQEMLQETDDMAERQQKIDAIWAKLGDKKACQDAISAAKALTVN